ncbi:MAG UNVERIFIED_CONTAM: peptidylprolyl isomerase [Rickettsiaceae bacterium]|jgi:peptidylprolyl isomerase
MKKWLICLISILSLGFMNNSLAESDISNKCMVLNLKDGDVYIKLRDDLAPNHVLRIIELTNKGFYNNLTFHRVIAGFMAQTGDPKGNGTGGSGQNIKAEFSKEPHVRGTVSMARAASPNSADSQFFIVFSPARYLDGQYSVFGQVVKGMEYVDLIKKGNPQDNGSVVEPDRIISAKIIDSSECLAALSE